MIFSIKSDGLTSGSQLRKVWFMGENADDTRTSPSDYSNDFSRSDFEPGQIVNGRYEVIGRLGQGGMGFVYKVRQILVDKEFALKTIDTNSKNPDKLFMRFQREARAAFALEHPNIIAVKDFGVVEQKQTPYLVMELIEGETLGERIKRSGQISLEDTISIFLPVCDALAFAHKNGIIHRDIKPSNIMLPSKMPLGSAGSVKLVDFGIAKFAAEESEEAQSLTRTGEIFGSPLYMSPEQCEGGTVDSRSDLYSLGCVLFECLTGSPPFMGESALSTMSKHMNAAIPTLQEASLGVKFTPAAERFISRMLAKNPVDRSASATEVAEALASLRSGGDLQKAKPAAEKNGSAARSLGMFSAFLVGVAAIGYGLWYSSKTEPTKTQTIKTATATTSGAAINSTTKVFDKKGSEEKIAATQRQRRDFKVTVKSEVKDGRQFLRMHFPPTTMGAISLIAPFFFSPDPNEVEAKGDVELPNVPLSLLVRADPLDRKEQLMGNEHLYSRLPTDKFSSLLLYVRPGEMDKFSAATGNFEFDFGQDYIDLQHSVLAASANWTQLKFLLLNNACLDAFTIKTISEYRALISLGLADCTFEPEILSQMILPKSLRILTLVKMPLHEFIPQLTTSNVVCLSLQDTVPARGDFDALSSYKSLESLHLRGTSCGIETVQMLPKLKHLKHIIFEPKDQKFPNHEFSSIIETMLQEDHLKSIWIVSPEHELEYSAKYKDPRLEWIGYVPRDFFATASSLQHRLQKETASSDSSNQSKQIYTRKELNEMEERLDNLIASGRQSSVEYMHLLERVTKISTSLNGPASQATLNHMLSLTDVLRMYTGDFAEAERVAGRARADYENAFSSNPTALYESILLRHGILLLFDHKASNAKQTFDKCRKVANALHDKKTISDVDVWTHKSEKQLNLEKLLEPLAVMKTSNERPEQYKKLLEEAVIASTGLYGPASPTTLTYLILLGDLVSVHSIDEAKVKYDEAATRYVKANGNTKSTIYGRILLKQGIVAFKKNQVDQAQNLFSKCVESGNELGDAELEKGGEQWLAQVRAVKK